MADVASHAEQYGPQGPVACRYANMALVGLLWSRHVAAGVQEAGRHSKGLHMQLKLAHAALEYMLLTRCIDRCSTQRADQKGRQLTKENCPRLAQAAACSFYNISVAAIISNDGASGHFSSVAQQDEF